MRKVILFQGDSITDAARFAIISDTLSGLFYNFLIIHFYVSFLSFLYFPILHSELCSIIF